MVHGVLYLSTIIVRYSGREKLTEVYHFNTSTHKYMLICSRIKKHPLGLCLTGVSCGALLNVNSEFTIGLGNFANTARQRTGHCDII